MEFIDLKSQYHKLKPQIDAAILLPKLAVLDIELAQRQQVATRYAKLFAKAGVNGTPFIETHNVSAWAQYTMRVPRREQVQKQLETAGVPTAVHYPIPLNKQPAVEDPSVQLPVGDWVAEQVISLPMSPYLSESDQGLVVSKLSEALA